LGRECGSPVFAPRDSFLREKSHENEKEKEKEKEHRSAEHEHG
jgi:hypothetical protein